MLVTQPLAEENQNPTFLNGLAAKIQMQLLGRTQNNLSYLRLALLFRTTKDENLSSIQYDVKISL